MQRDRKVSVDLMVTSTGRGYVRPRKAVPGLLWTELVQLMGDWGEFTRGHKGTRFDRWLPKETQHAN